jgi:arylsulfatase A-like enzyme
VERAIEIINSHDKKEPLFLYYAAQNPHSGETFDVPEEYSQRYENLTRSINRRKILGMVTLLDESIFNITKALENNGMLDDTIIVFTSDVLSFLFTLFELISF